MIIGSGICVEIRITVAWLLTSSTFLELLIHLLLINHSSVTIIKLAFHRDLVDLVYNGLKRVVNILRILCTRLNELDAYKQQALQLNNCKLTMLLRKGTGLLEGHLTHVFQVTFVANEGDDDVLVGVVPQFHDPSLNVFKRLEPSDVVNQQGSDGIPVVSIGHGAISLLACGVPDLGAHIHISDLNGLGCELHSDGGLTVLLELVPNVPQE